MSDELITGSSQVLVSNHVLQTFILPPRSRDDPKSPRIISGSKTASEGKDGRWYKLLDEQDQQSFKILSNIEVQKELEKSRELFSARTLSSSPDSFSASFNASYKHERRTSPLKALGSVGVGVISESRRGATKAWLNDVELSNNSRATASASAAIDSNSGGTVTDPIIKSLIDNGGVQDKELLSIRFRESLLTSKDDSGLSDASNAHINNNSNIHNNVDENSDPNSSTRRPQSASVSPPKFRISNNLQSTIDNYVQRKKNQDEFEKQKQYEQEVYLLSLKEKTIRASLDSGAGVISMLARQNDYLTKAEAKAKKKQEEEETLKRLEKEKFETRKKQHLSKPIIRHEKTLQQLEDEENLRRKERVRKRQLELKEESAAPVFSAANRSPSRKQAEPYKPFKAEDPEKVRKNLEHQSQVWKSKMKKISDKLKMETEEKNRDAARSQPGAIYESMKARNDYYEQKRRTKHELKLETEKLEKEAKLAEEMVKKQKLLNMKVPEASRRLTKKVELQAKIVKENLGKNKEEDDFTFTSFKAKDPEEVIKSLRQQQELWSETKERRQKEMRQKYEEKNRISRQAELINEQLLSRQEMYRNKAAGGSKKCISCKHYIANQLNDSKRFNMANEKTQAHIDTKKNY